MYSIFEKALDRVNLSLLLNKMRGLGAGSLLMSWFGSYSTDRIQRVRTGN